MAAAAAEAAASAAAAEATVAALAATTVAAAATAAAAGGILLKLKIIVYSKDQWTHVQYSIVFGLKQRPVCHVYISLDPH